MPPNATPMPNHETSLTEQMPPAEDVAAVYDYLVKLADDYLDRPVSTRMKTWEDGEFEIRVWHKWGRAGEDVTYRDLLRYHSREDSLQLGTVERNPETGERTILSNEVLQADDVLADAKKT